MSDTATETRDFDKKLQHAIRRVGLTPQSFVDQFSKFSKLRKAVVLEYLAGMREPYGANLEKLVDFLRRFAPNLTALDFSAEFGDFERRLEAALTAPKRDSLSLPLQMAPLSVAQISALVGSYRIFRYASDAEPRIISEALSIEPLPRPSSTTDALPNALFARLWSVADGGNRVYEGFVSVAGEQVNIMVAHSGDSGDSTRFLALRATDMIKSSRQDGVAPDRALAGVMTGAVDDASRIGTARVAVLRYFDNHRLAGEDAKWRTWNATADDSVDKNLLLILGQPRAT